MNTIGLRVILLATLLFGVNAWMIRHLGTGLREFAVVNAFFGFVTLVLGWIDKCEGDGIQGKIKDFLRRSVEAPVLIQLYVVTIVATSLVSSVTVLADGEGRQTALYLTPEGQTVDESSEKLLDGPSDIARYIRITSIFGRAFYLEASGYQRRSLTLHPWTGATISLSSDLVQLPTILLRIPASLHSSLAGGKVVVELRGGQSSNDIPLDSGHGSVQIGPAAAIPEAWRSDWRSELRAIDGIPVSVQEQIFRNWRNPIRNESLPPLVPGQRLLVRFMTSGDKEVVRQDVVVGRESLQDVVLIRRSQAE